MILLFNILTLGICILMFLAKPINKIVLLLIPIMLYTTDIPFLGGISWIDCQSAIIYCFLLSESSHLVRTWRSFPMKIPLIIVTISVLFIAFNSSLLVSSQKIFMPIKRLLVGKYLFIFYGFLLSYKYSFKKIYPKIEKTILYSIIILTLFGLYNLIFHDNFYINSLSKLSNQENLNATHFLGLSRMRVNSLFRNPFDYGYVCLVAILFTLYGASLKIANKRRLIIIIIGALFGVIFAGSRTIILCLLLGFGIFAKFDKRISLIKYGLILFIIGIILYTQIPQVTTLIDSTFLIFDKNAVLSESSSIEMRIKQIQGSILYFLQNPIVGNGYLYISYLSGYESIVQDMRGFETVLCYLFIEEGIIGFLYYILFYGSLLYFFLKKKPREIYFSGVIFISIGILFALATSELDSAPITLLFSGIVMGANWGMIKIKSNDLEK